jgi:hypothetical protein
MTDQELRTLVRDAIARHLAAAPDLRRPQADDAAMPASFLRQHASHGMFTLPDGADSDGPCVIEPSVRCNHCGYCKSYGH